MFGRKMWNKDVFARKSGSAAWEGSGRLVALADAVKLHCISAVGVLAVTAGINGGTDGDAARSWLIPAGKLIPADHSHGATVLQVPHREDCLSPLI